jgi:PAS domain S-box-containing protein
MDVRSADPLMAFDDDLRVLSWNEAAESLTGIPAREAVGRYCWEVLGAKDDRGALVCHAGCSNARLMRDGWPLATRRLWIRTTAGRRRVSLATVAVQGLDRGLFLHVLRNGEEVLESAVPEAPSLTRRQREILALIADGVPAKVIALRLRLSETTVRNHIRGILSRLGAHSQLEAVASARRFGLVP